MSQRNNRLLTLCVLGTALTACTSLKTQFSGPATTSPNPSLSQAVAKPIPRVQDCGVLNTGTPSRFVCNGKVYTSYQLAKLREDEAKKLTSGN